MSSRKANGILRPNACRHRLLGRSYTQAMNHVSWNSAADVGRHEGVSEQTHLLCHTDEGKSLMDKYMKHMPFLGV